MPLSTAERKHLMPHGSQRVIAKELGVTEAYVSLAINGGIQPKTEASQKKLRRVQVAIARKLRRTVADVFPEGGTQQEAAPPLAHAS